MSQLKPSQSSRALELLLRSDVIERAPLLEALKALCAQQDVGGVLEQILARALADQGAQATGPQLVVHPSGRRASFGEVELDLSRRQAIPRVLRALVAQRLEAPGEALGAQALISAGWPGEVLAHESAIKRLHTAIWTLRTMGLEPALLTLDGGYMIAAHVNTSWQQP